VYLTDFGLTKRLGATTAGLTRPGQWLGTPDYAAPEQIQGLDVDARTDVYSLGCVVHELLTGHRPYERDTLIATLWAHIADPPPRPCAHRSDLRPVFDTVIARATAKESQQRFSSAGALSRALDEAVVRQLASEAHNPTALARTARATVGAHGAKAPPSATAATRPMKTEADPGVVTNAPPEPARMTPDSELAPTVAAREPESEQSGSRRRRLLTVAGLLAAAVVAVVIGIALSAGSTARRPANAVTPAMLKQDVGRLNSIVQLFIAGKRLSHVEHKYTAAAQNRRLVLDRLSAFHAPPQLRAAAETLRQMTTDSLSFNLYMARGQTALARAPDNAHNALRPRFVAEFNPFVQRYLGLTYAIDEL
jgi:Protein kinase domain